MYGNLSAPRRSLDKNFLDLPSPGNPVVWWRKHAEQGAPCSQDSRLALDLQACLTPSQSQGLLV